MTYLDKVDEVEEHVKRAEGEHEDDPRAFVLQLVLDPP